MRVVVLGESDEELIHTDLPDDAVGRVDTQAARRGVSREEMLILLIEYGLAGAEQDLRQRGKDPS